MAAAAYASARPTLSFHLSQPSVPSPRFNFKPPLVAFPPLQRSAAARPIPIFTLNSIDVSKEDKPTSDDPDLAAVVGEEAAEEKLDRRRMEEKFAVLNTGIYECRSCGHKFDEAVGDPTYPIAPGLPFEQLPEDWRCPTCGAAKSFFESKSVEIAGSEGSAHLWNLVLLLCFVPLWLFLAMICFFMDHQSTGALSKL
ncbi:hypothetical protein SDJN03_09068, partial [Cucurbita argyrosperma subsp. sororia]